MMIHDTLTGKLNEVNTQNVRIYLCGVTVYDESHIGHARTIIIFDVLRRFLENKGKKINFVQNFTDVDDKIINRASKEGVSASEISEKYIQNYFNDFDTLNIKRATTYPKATEHIQDMLDLISGLIEQKIAYVSKHGVYFAVSKFQEYGKLSKKKIDDLQSGARIEIDEQKNNPLDFALWKFSDSEPTWNSPWGKGRPGWHIECSAMSLKYLGNSFDIHGGGRDLIFPHHENEIAQSEAFTRKEFAKTWMHVGMVTINGEKMSKSLGNIKTIKHVLENWGPNIIRLFCLSGHYSKPIDYSEDLLRENITKWRQVEAAYYEMIHSKSQGNAKDLERVVENCKKSFDDALNDDMDTHLATVAFFKLVKEINRIASEEELTKSISSIFLTEFNRMLGILGLYIPEISDDEITKVNKMLEDREKFRKDKNYEQADKIRDEISSRGIELIDHKSRTIWMKKERIKSDR
ncbi:cysteine--tRNA ligase [Nitrosopumilus sp. b1]|uniref:cysteine--tRNA ligase n=1 Tax=Nitrosopumilus sp. b1 TaxID=2109907 RepID=UPI0015F5B517|nr:cysteine--tRNA ligase [Nitrosopumilus sp. b1]KAF6243386.1 cysteine--tRNA ligase [Nitrosopumilus sp. b1]